MGAADEGNDMVLAMRVEFDVAQHDDVVIAFDLVEGARQRLHRVLLIALEELVIGLDHALRRVEQALAVGIVACPGDQRADGLFGLLLARPFDIWAATWRHDVDG